MSAILLIGCSERADKSGAQATAESQTRQAPKAAEETDKPRPRGVWVQQARANRQCTGGGLSLQHSADKLVTSGVRVLESRCGVRTAATYSSGCGDSSLEILLHRIAAVHLDAALELGFNPAQADQFQFSKCSEEETWAITP